MELTSLHQSWKEPYQSTHGLSRIKFKDGDNSQECIIDGAINGENTDFQSRIKRDEDRLDNSIATLNFALAEYTMIFEDEFAREALDKVDIATNKQHNKLYKLYKDSLDQKDMVKSTVI